MNLDVIIDLAQDVHLSAINLKGKPLELFKILREKPSIRDVDIIKDWYGEDKLGSNYLWKIKQRLFRTLLDFHLGKPPEEFGNALQKDFFHCQRINALANILIGRNRPKAAIILAEDAIKKAIKHQFTGIVISLAKILLYHYGVIGGDRKKMEGFRKTLQTSLEVQQWEVLAETYYIDIVSSFPATKKVPLELLQRAVTYLGELTPKLNQLHSTRFHLLTFNLIVVNEKMKGDQIGIVESCQKALDYFKEKKNVPRGVYFAFNYSQIPPLIILGKFHRLEEATTASLALSPTGSFNWVAIQQYQIIGHFYQGQFEEAYHLISQYKSEAQKHDTLHEMWLVLEAYVHLFTNRSYRLQRFLNEVPVYSKDKRGMNINLLIIQILFHLQRRQFGRIIDKTKAIQHYATRYLYDDSTLRSNCLIKMILVAEKYKFNGMLVEKRTADLLDKMSAAPIRDIDVEPVKYEVLWEKVLQLLK